MLIAAPAAERVLPRIASRALRIAVLGNPNTGKTTIFNLLCGARAKTSNFPGTTTAIRTGRATMHHRRLEVVDLPGVYDLHYACAETQIARDVCSGTHAERPDAIVLVVDACNLTRNLVLAGQILAYGYPTVLAINMVDLARRRGLAIDAAALSRRLGVPVVPTIARTGKGLDALVVAIDGALAADARGRLTRDVPPAGATTESLTAWDSRVAGDSI